MPAGVAGVVRPNVLQGQFEEHAGTADAVHEAGVAERQRRQRDGVGAGLQAERGGEGAEDLRHAEADQVAGAGGTEEVAEAAVVPRDPEAARGQVERLRAVEDPGQRFPSAARLLTVLGEGENSSWWAGRELLLLTAVGHLPRIPVRRETGLHGREEESRE